MRLEHVYRKSLIPADGEDDGAAFKRWQSEEERRARAEPAPEPYDAHVPADAQHAINVPLLRCMLAMTEVFFCGDKAWGLPNMPDQGFHGRIPPLFFAAMLGSVEMARAVLRRGASLDAQAPAYLLEESSYEMEGTALYVACESLRRIDMSEAPSGGPAESVDRLATARFLLSVGADPNEAAPSSGLTPLHSACEAGCMELAEALLAHGARPTPLDRSGRSPASLLATSALQALFKRKVRAAATGAREPARCPCGSGRPLERCHGAPDGVPMHPDTLCPCEHNVRLLKPDSGQAPSPGQILPRLRTYGNCCQKRRTFFRETLSRAFGPPQVVPPVGHSQFVPRNGESMEEQIRAFNQSLGMTGDMLNRSRAAILRPLMQPVVAMGRMDPCFAAICASGECDFMYMQPWLSKGLSQNEQSVRMHEWNALVDSFISRNHESCAGRSPTEVARECKVDSHGCRLLHQCAHSGCGRWEETKGEFQRCSGCRGAAYCSRECQKAAWQRGHRAACKDQALCTGGVRHELWLKSSLAVNQIVVDDLMSAAATGPPPEIAAALAAAAASAGGLQF